MEKEHLGDDPRVLKDIKTNFKFGIQLAGTKGAHLISTVS